MYNCGIHTVLYSLQDVHNIIIVLIVCPRYGHGNNKLSFSFLNSYNSII